MGSLYLFTSSLNCRCPSPHYSGRCIKAQHVVFLPHYSHGLRLPPSYCFVLDHLFINQIRYFLPPNALMRLAITPLTIPSITERLSAQLHWPLHCPPSSHSPQHYWLTPHYWDFPSPAIFRISTSFGATGFLLDSWTQTMGPIGCAETSVRNYHFSLHNNPAEYRSQLLCGGCLKSSRY